MAVNKRRLIPLHVAICAIFIIGLLHMPSTTDLPEEIDRAEVVSINGVPIPSANAIHPATDLRHVGDVVSIGLKNGETRTVRLEQRYGLGYMILNTLAGLTYFILAVFVFDRRPNDKAAHVFYALAMMVGLQISSSPCGPEPFGIQVGLFYRVLWSSTYGLLPAILFHFTTVFPERARLLSRRTVPVLYTIGGMLSAALAITVLNATVDMLSDRETPWSQAYVITHRSIQYWYAAIMFLSLGRMAFLYMTSTNVVARNKILWLLLGVTVSGLGFVALWLLPQTMFGHPLISDEVLIALALIAPITFAISIVRYQALDINIIVKTSIVHGLVICIGLSMYIAILSYFFDIRMGEELFYIIAGLILLDALLFTRLKVFVQRLLDRTLFKVQHRYSVRQSKLLESIRSALTLEDLQALVVRTVDAELRPRGVLVVLRNPLTGKDRTESIGDVEPAFYHRELRSATEGALGFVALSQRQSAITYTDDDVDLLDSMCKQVELQVERLVLSQRVVIQQAEQERLEELNRLKSQFVSGVTHDLKTPITSIRMFAEILSSRVETDQERQYVSIIEGESMRLARLIDQVLDYAKAERGVMEYRVSRVDVNETVRHCMDIMRYQFRMADFEVVEKISPEPCFVLVSEDHFVNSVINLLSNALKYSRRIKRVVVATEKKGNQVHISVQDNGIGIEESMIGKIQEPFMRVRDAETEEIAGTGLGLAMVQHFIQAHDGRLIIESTPGQGSMFTIVLALA